MNTDYLTKPSTQNYNPAIKGNSSELPLKDMEWEDFEKLCLRMVQDVEHFEITDCDILGRRGQKQDGIDIYARKSNDLYDTFQSKRYKKISISKLKDVFKEFKNGKWFAKTERFYLCTSADFNDVKLQEEYENIKTEYSKFDIDIFKWDSSYFNRTLKTYPQIVYDFFGKNWCVDFCGEDLFNNTVNTIQFEELVENFESASLFLSEVKNYFERKISTHIKRKETNNIFEWANNDLKKGKKNILILEGEKGVGKSVILKDTYDLFKRNGFLVLGIKADKYYASTPGELENKIFMDDKLSFKKIIKAINYHKKKLIIIIDQLDALSQTLSSSREYIQTYNRIINELKDEKNIRVLISSRTFDLNYDAELSVYKSAEYENIKTSLLTDEEVKITLKYFGVTTSSKKFINLLRTPNHLEIFCKLPTKDNINFNTLITLKDLYDELWRTLINNKSKLNLNDLLAYISNEMYKSQQIIINSNKIINYDSELKYLLSNNLLIQNSNHIQFFHQTFYEYCFARQFVEKNKNIAKYILENRQSLYVRSIIKLVLEYLREYNHSKYIDIISKILKSKKYRFHIKSLLISNFGMVEEPSVKEIKIANFLLKNDLYEKAFLNSIYSKKWVLYMLDKKIPEKFIFVKKRKIHNLYEWFSQQKYIQYNIDEKFNLNKVIEKNTNEIWTFFVNNINILPNEILRYLDGLDDFQNKNNFIERIIYNIDEWEHKGLQYFFLKYLPYRKNDNFWFYQILPKIFKYNQKFVLELLKPILLEVFEVSYNTQQFSHDQKRTLEEIYKIDSKIVFDFLIDLYSDIINNNKSFYNYEETGIPYFNCTKFSSIKNSVKYADEYLENFMFKHLLIESSQFKNFYDKYKKTESIYMLRLLLLVLMKKPKLYKNEVFELLNIIHLKKIFNDWDDEVQLFLRKLISLVFSDLTSNEKDRVVDILLSIKEPKYYPEYKFEKLKLRNSYGKKQFKFLSLLPEKELKSNYKLKKKHQELKRKFGEINPKKADHISSMTSYAVGAPLKGSAYSNMNLKEWLNSFLIFDDNYKEGHGPKGGKTEHSRMFSDIVQSEPDKFYQFIIELFNNKKVSIDYISSGIDGLIKAEYSPDKVKTIINKLIKIDLDRTNTLYTIWKISYLIDNGIIDKEIITFLSHSALHHFNPDRIMNEDDPLFDSMNSVRGAAIHRIIKCYVFKEFEELIFETIEKAVNDPYPSIKVAILQNLAYLNHLNLKRSFQIFTLLTNENNVTILKHSQRASQYFNVKYHNKMSLYYDKIIEHEELHENANIIVLSWLNDKINNFELYKKFISSSNKAKLCALKVAEANLLNPNENISKKSLIIINSFLNNNPEIFASSYSGMILRIFNSNNFNKLYPFLIRYSKSEMCFKEPSYFLELLLKSAKDYPKECLTLIQNIKLNKNPNIQNQGYYRNEPIQLILAIYSKLNTDFQKNSKLIDKSLDVFDSMLTHSNLRKSASRAIDLTL